MKSFAARGSFFHQSGEPLLSRKRSLRKRTKVVIRKTYEEGFYCVKQKCTCSGFELHRNWEALLFKYKEEAEKSPSKAEAMAKSAAKVLCKHCEHGNIYHTINPRTPSQDGSEEGLSRADSASRSATSRSTRDDEDLSLNESSLLEDSVSVESGFQPEGMTQSSSSVKDEQSRQSENHQTVCADRYHEVGHPSLVQTSSISREVEVLPKGDVESVIELLISNLRGITEEPHSENTERLVQQSISLLSNFATKSSLSMSCSVLDSTTPRQRESPSLGPVQPLHERIEYNIKEYAEEQAKLSSKPATKEVIRKGNRLPLRSHASFENLGSINGRKQSEAEENVYEFI